MSKAKKTAQEPEKKPVESLSAPGAIVYCGPSIKGVVHQYTVFDGDIPANLKAIIDRNPMMKALIVPVEQFAAFKTELRQPGSSAYFIYQNVIKSYTRG